MKTEQRCSRYTTKERAIECACGQTRTRDAIRIATVEYYWDGDESKQASFMLDEVYGCLCKDDQGRGCGWNWMSFDGYNLNNGILDWHGATIMNPVEWEWWNEYGRPEWMAHPDGWVTRYESCWLPQYFVQGDRKKAFFLDFAKHVAPKKMVAIELNGEAYHDEGRDRWRDHVLSQRGIEVIRYRAKRLKTYDLIPKPPHGGRHDRYASARCSDPLGTT